VLEIDDLVLEIMDQADLKPVILNQASQEIRERYMSCAKARELLSWVPASSSEAGLRETVDWYREHFSKVHTVDEQVGADNRPERSLKAGGRQGNGAPLEE
jgi:dTDP-D-glucose 4,6-dehydratase